MTGVLDADRNQAERTPSILTGVGKVNAAAALASVLARGHYPSLVINLGTAGALRPGWEGTHAIGKVLQHDLNGDVLRQLTGESAGASQAGRHEPLRSPRPNR